MMSDDPLVFFVLFPLAAYVVGSTPFGVLIARARGVDLRKAGSGNVGATNVGRTLGRKWGYLCFALDVGKGLICVVLAGWHLRRLGGPAFPTLAQQASWLAVGFAVIAGHVFSFWLKFRGGKGVATALGVVVGMYPYFTFPGLAALAIWIAVTLISRYVSLGSIAAAGAFLPLFALFNYAELADLWPMIAFAGVIVTLIVIRHRTNIRRLLAGTENKIARRRKSPVPAADDGEAKAEK